MQDHPIILFDGVCNFCNGVINFIIRRDKERVFRYAALQSDAGQRLLRQYGLSPGKMDSFVLIEDGKAYQKSAAAFRLYPRLGGAWKLVKALGVLPRFLCDFGYDIIARNRYRWWGKKQACMVPTPDVRSLFLS